MTGPMRCDWFVDIYTTISNGTSTLKDVHRGSERCGLETDTNTYKEHALGHPSWRTTLAATGRQEPYNEETP